MVFLLVMLGIFGGSLFAITDERGKLIAGIIFPIIIIIHLIYVFITPIILKKKTRLKLYEDKIIYNTGFIFLKEVYLPISKLQQIEIKTDIINKGFKASKLRISTSFLSFVTYELDTKICEEIVNLITNKNAGEK